MDEVTGETARQKAEQNNILQIQKLHDRGSNPTTKNTNKSRTRRSQSNVAAIVREQGSLQAPAPEKGEEKEETYIDPNSSDAMALGLTSQKTLGEKSLKKSVTTLNGLKKSKDGHLKSSLDVVQEDSNHHDSRSSLENEDEEKRDEYSIN